MKDERMKTKLRRIFTRYFNSWWIPATLCIVLIAILFGLTTQAKFQWPETSPLNSTASAFVLCGLAIACCGLTCSLVWHLLKQKWQKLGAGLLGALFVLVGLYFVGGGIVTLLWLWPVEDSFADNLTIPEGIEISEPIGQDVKAGDESDAFQKAVLAASAQPSSDDSTVTASIDSLIALYANAPDVLMRYLAMSPAWFVSEGGGGGVVAARRWQMNSTWQNNSGQYSEAVADDSPETSSEATPLSLLLRIHFYKYPLATSTFTTFLSPGETAALNLSNEGESGYSSRVMILAGDFFVEIIEDSSGQGRQLTKAALSFLENEMASLAENPSEATIRAALPINSIEEGTASIELKDLSQPGLYQVTSWLNPGESGSVYLKAFEVTQNTPLSAQLLRLESEERMGWSDRDELFMANADIKIDEGSWGKPYAARFEVWFSPDVGTGDSPEGTLRDRKLLESVFKIEGWQS